MVFFVLSETFGKLSQQTVHDILQRSAMIIQSFPAISPKLRSLVRSFMLMEIEVSQRQHFSHLSVPASDITALLLQLSGQGGYHRHLQTSERVSLEKPYIHGQITNVDYGGAELGSNDNEDIALFGVVFTPTGMQAFVRKNLGGLDQIENTFMSASSIIPHVEVLQEELQETYHQCHRRRTRNKQEAAGSSSFYAILQTASSCSTRRKISSEYSQWHKCSAHQSSHGESHSASRLYLPTPRRNAWKTKY
jgi:hypothetical protein